MGKLFANMTTEGLEETTDRLGGGFAPKESGVYDATVKAAYAGSSARGAMNVTLILDLQGIGEYTETIYITNAEGQNYYLNKNDKKKKVPLPGFTTINDLCLATTGLPLFEQDTDEKIVAVYDYDEKKDVNKSVDMLVDLLGKNVTVGILKNLENKNEKDGNGVYQPTAETRETNVIDKIFEYESKLTIPEASKGMEEADFYAKWKETNTGVTKDRRKIKDGQGGNAGNSGPPTAGESKAPRKSLFAGK